MDRFRIRSTVVVSKLSGVGAFFAPEPIWHHSFKTRKGGISLSTDVSAHLGIPGVKRPGYRLPERVSFEADEHPIAYIYVPLTSSPV